MTEENQNTETGEQNQPHENQPSIPDGYVSVRERDNAAAAARRDGENAGKSTAERGLLERYGVSSFEDLDAAMREAQEKADAEKSEIQRADSEKEKAQKARDEARNKEAAATEMAEKYIRVAEIKVQAAALGVGLERLDYMVRLADSSVITVEEGVPDAKAAKKAVEAVLEDVPELAAKEEKSRRAVDTTRRQTNNDNLRGADRLRNLNW